MYPTIHQSIDPSIHPFVYPLIHLPISLQLLYTDKIPLVIHQNPQADLVLNVVGQGSEPQVVFDKNLIEFLPILPFSDASDGEVTVTNPMDYPVEIYSLEFDKQYSKEEEVKIERDSYRYTII